MDATYCFIVYYYYFLQLAQSQVLVVSPEHIASKTEDVVLVQINLQRLKNKSYQCHPTHIWRSYRNAVRFWGSGYKSLAQILELRCP